MSRIVVVEDDHSVCEMLELFLKKEGYEVQTYHQGIGVLEELRHFNPDLIILDWMLSGKNGLEILHELRQFSDVPVVMLTAKDTDTDQVMGLEGGADDYVTKPFSPFTLLARIKAILRRFQPAENSNSFSQRIEGKHFIINLDTFEVVLNETNILDLTPREFELLSFMARYPKHVFSREQLIDQIWGYDFIGDGRTVDAHVKRLRKKIQTPPFTWIHTVWGIGYKFDEDIQDEN